ncbi:hypothetical protein JTB14_025897 [Gonioctena quinquepunctata]|nr:hypothetical protein JTB14_025897 [Gonioctena quinquepunctata]
MKEQEKEPPDKEEPKQDATPQEDEKGTLPLAEGSPSQTSKDELVQTNDEFRLENLEVNLAENTGNKENTSTESQKNSASSSNFLFGCQVKPWHTV